MFVLCAIQKVSYAFLGFRTRTLGDIYNIYRQTQSTTSRIRGSGSGSSSSSDDVASKRQIYSNMQSEGGDRDGDADGDIDKRTSSTTTNNQKKNKYVLGDNLEDAESSGFYWNSFDSVNDVIDTGGTSNGNDTQSQTSQKSDTSSENASNDFTLQGKYKLGLGKNNPIQYLVEREGTEGLKVNSEEGKFLSRAFWFYDGQEEEEDHVDDTDTSPKHVDFVWEIMRREAMIEAEREPLLVSFLYSTILNHPNLESALAFHLANRLTSPSMDAIQLMGVILESLTHSPTFSEDLRADLLAVRERDPACTCLPDVFLHFKGFHALQSYRVSNHLWKSGKKTLAHYVQSQMSQNFQIDIHPNATLKSGIMFDHGTGVVIGETAMVGYNCSILHGVTLGGSGLKGVDRHPKIGDGVLLGAGATLLGNIHVGNGVQVGAGTLVIDDLPAHSVAVGVPSKIIGTYKEEALPSQTMDQNFINSFSMDGI